MTDSPSVAPALTIADFPVKYSYVLYWTFQKPQGVLDDTVSKGVVMLTIEEDERRKKLEAHGFTEADVEAIYDAIGAVKQEYGSCPKDINGIETEPYLAQLESLASRIEKLLPPPTGDHL